jgi:hypothetical protein
MMTGALALSLIFPTVAVAAPPELTTAVRHLGKVADDLRNVDSLPSVMVTKHKQALDRAAKELERWRCDPDISVALNKVHDAVNRLHPEERRYDARRIADETRESVEVAIRQVNGAHSWRHDRCPGTVGNKGGFPFNTTGGEVTVQELTVGSSSVMRADIAGHTGGRGYAGVAVDVISYDGSKPPVVNTAQVRKADGGWLEYRVTDRTHSGRNDYRSVTIPQGAKELVISFADTANARIRVLLLP